MDARTASLEALDWPYVVQAWAEYTRTPLGTAAVLRAEPMSDLATIRKSLDAVGEWLFLADNTVNTGLGGVADIRVESERAGRGEVLDDADLRKSGQTLSALLTVEHTLAQHSDVAPTLAWTASVIALDPDVAQLLNTAWGPTGELSASVWPVLGQLRSRINELHAQVRSTLDSMVASEDMADHLQDRFWTQRERRYVLPLKHHAKNMGIVHSTSRTGQTVFVEPHQVVALNNSLRVAEGELAAEEHRIRAQLSRALGGQAPAIQVALTAATVLDVAGARAGLARRLEATRPKLGTDGVIWLQSARHPVLFLRGVDVVPNDLGLASDRPALVISGPNAGGKTIALKTVGLCALLVQHGHYIPAAEDSRVDLFDSVFAAIGDAQTVEGDLSSFSGHLVALKGLLEAAGPGTLALLDEIATGTDPAQGAALAQAVLEALLDKQARLVVTTHFARLKGLAATDPRFAMAATAYEGGLPTYQLVDGATGESRAFDLARRVGLDKQLLSRATGLMDHGEAELSKALDALDSARGQASAQTRSLEERQLELERRTQKLSRREAQITAKSEALEAAGAEAYLDRLRSAERAIGQVVADLQRNPSHKGVTAARASVDALRALAPATAPSEPPAPPALKVGDRVRLRRGGSVGQVIEVKAKSVRMRAGGLTLTVKPSELERLAPNPTPKQAHRNPARTNAAATGHAVRIGSNTLDMRGMRVEEGMTAAEAFFDKAMLTGHDAVFLLHGHGTGALKQALRGWLRSSVYVASFEPACEEQGGDAFTMVNLS
jgi:DNA mismatch repair protein MutS2